MIAITSTGVSPAFTVSAEEFATWYAQCVTRVSIDGVEPPILGEHNGKSFAHNLTNKWHPWIDEHIVEPKFDGIHQYLGTISNSPTLVKDYHMISLMRATDAILSPAYVGLIVCRTSTVLPTPPPKGT